MGDKNDEQKKKDDEENEKNDKNDKDEKKQKDEKNEENEENDTSDKTDSKDSEETDDKKTVKFEKEDADEVENENDSIEEILQKIDYNDHVADENKEEVLNSAPSQPAPSPAKRDSTEVTEITSGDLNKFLQQYGMGGITPINSNTMMGEAFIYMKIPPDGGYAWIILAASVACLVVADGHTFTLGINLPVIGKELTISDSNQSLIVAFQQAAYYFSGPVSSAFIHKYGFIKVGLVGGFLSTLAYIMGSFANSFLYLILVFGIICIGISGIGFGMIWCASALIIGYYFEKYRPIASGISCAGSGLGMLIFSKFNTYLIHQVGWRNQFRISSIFVAITGLLCFVYVGVKPTIIGKVQIPEEGESRSEPSVEIATARYSKYAVSTTELGLQERQMETKAKKKKRCSWLYQKLYKCSPCCRRTKRKAPSSEEHRYVINNDLLDREDIFYTGKADYKKAPDIAKTPINQSDSNKEHNVGYSMSMIRPPQPPKKKKRRWISPKITNAFNLLFDCSLLSIFEFKLLLLSAFLYNLGSNIPFLYVEARSHIEDKYRSNILPVIGAANIVFRILAGFFTYKYDVDKSLVCGSGAFLAGVVTFISAFYGRDLAWFQILYGALFGTGNAIFMTLRALVYVQVLGLDKLTNAFGLTAAILGIGVFIGSYAGGLLIQITGDYTASFASAGVFIIASGTIKLILPKIIETRARKKAEM